MPGAKYVGSDTGEGNPPGKYSKGYLSEPTGEYKGGGHFVNDKSYRGSMHVGMNETASEIGMEPKMSKESGLESHANKEDSIPSVGSSKK